MINFNISKNIKNAVLVSATKINTIKHGYISRKSQLAGKIDSITTEIAETVVDAMQEVKINEAMDASKTVGGAVVRVTTTVVVNKALRQHRIDNVKSYIRLSTALIRIVVRLVEIALSPIGYVCDSIIANSTK